MPVTSSRAFRFGVIAGGARGARAWASLAQRAEQLGYSVLLCSDHLDLSGTHFTDLSPVPALAAAAAATHRIALGTSVFNQDLRHPAVLAQEVASLDILSEGRFEIGLGAGWAENEYDWAGLRFDPIGTRIERLAEYTHIVKALLEEREVSFEGTHFRITKMPGGPTPVRQPRPPIMMGGAYRRMLCLAAREADIVSILCPSSASAAMEERLEWIRDAAGERFGELELSTVVMTVAVGGGGRHDLARVANERQGAQGVQVPLSEDELLNSPSALVGSVDSIAEKLMMWRARWGISYVIIGYPQMEEFGPVVEQLARDG
jgi:probable F420-dependent oxidoreductase